MARIFTKVHDTHSSMFPLPEWAPNVHPLIVHFPIGILFTAAIFDLVGLVFRNQDFPRRAAMVLYVLGGIAAATAYFTGEAAADSVFLPTEANALLTEHSDLGHYVFYFFGGYAVIRAATFFAGLERTYIVRVGLALLGVAGLGLLTYTADHGAEMVFRYGVGVQAVNTKPVVPVSPSDSVVTGPRTMENGGWTWKPRRAAAWRAHMAIEGDLASSSLRDGGTQDGVPAGDVLGLTPGNGPVTIWFEHALETAQIDAALNLDDFNGSVMIVHNLVDARNYHFTVLTDEEMRQGTSSNGDFYIMDAKPVRADGWHRYRVVSDQTHFRAYMDERLVTHGHGEAPPSGHVGIRLSGSGTVLLDYIQVVPVR